MKLLHSTAVARRANKRRLGQIVKIELTDPWGNVISRNQMTEREWQKIQAQSTTDKQEASR